MRCINYKKYSSPYYYYPYGRSITMTGTVSPDHSTLSSGSRGYVTTYIYKKMYNSKTRKYYSSLVKKGTAPLSASGAASTWKYSYKGGRGTYKLKAYFPGDANHLSAWAKTRYAKVY